MSSDDAPLEPGGDPACWLARVCDRCGGLTDDRDSDRCDRCGAALPDG